MVNLQLGDSSRPEEKTVRHFLRARGTITGGHKAHLSALAYMSDSYFIGTVARVQNIPPFASPDALKEALSGLKNPSDLNGDTIAKYRKDVAEQEKRLQSRATPVSRRKEIGMMVSLDHAIYFHNRRNFKADDWIFREMSRALRNRGRASVCLP